MVQAPPGAIALHPQPQNTPCSAAASCACLCARSFVAFDTWMHDVSLAVYSESSVLANGRGLDLSIDTQGGFTNGRPSWVSFLSRPVGVGC